MIPINDSDELLALMLTETRRTERVRLATLFTTRLNNLAAHIHRYQLTGPEAAELLLNEEEKLRADSAEVC